MSHAPPMPNDERRNGHATVAREVNRPPRPQEQGASEEMEPKGYPTADRYRAETVHSSETHDPGKTEPEGDEE